AAGALVAGAAGAVVAAAAGFSAGFGTSAPPLAGAVGAEGVGVGGAAGAQAASRAPAPARAPPSSDRRVMSRMMALPPRCSEASMAADRPSRGAQGMRDDGPSGRLRGPHGCLFVAVPGLVQ